MLPGCPSAAERVGDPGDASLVGDDLLGPQGDTGRLLGGQCQGLVVTVGVQALGAAEYAGQGLEGDPGDVDLGLLGGQGHTGRLGVEPQLHAALVGGSVAITHPSSPDASGGPELADLLEEVEVAVEEEAQAGREVVDG